PPLHLIPFLYTNSRANTGPVPRAIFIAIHIDQLSALCGANRGYRTCNAGRAGARDRRSSRGERASAAQQRRLGRGGPIGSTVIFAPSVPPSKEPRSRAAVASTARHAARSTVEGESRCEFCFQPCWSRLRS